MFPKSLMVATFVLSAMGVAFCQTNPPGAASEPAPAAEVNPANPAVPPPRPRPRMLRPERYMGTLIRVEGTNLIIDAKQPGGAVKRVTVPADSQAEIRINGSPAQLQDLKPEMSVTTMRMGITPSTPGKLRVMAREPELTGTLVKVDGTSLVVRVGETGSEPHDMTVQTDGSTQIQTPVPTEEGGFTMQNSGKLADLKPGTTLRVFPPRGIATSIRVVGTANRPTAPTNSPPAVTK